MRPHVIAWLDGFLPHEVSATIAPTWFTCVGLAGLVTLVVMMLVARRRGIDPFVIASAVLWCYVAAVAAGIVIPMTIDAVEQLVTTGSVHVRWAGMTSFWGYLAGMTAVILVCRHHGLSVAQMGDMSAAPLGLALALSRVGCFLGGCDYGKVTSVPWAMRFPQGSPAWQDHVGNGLVPASRGESLPVHPTQLYEALLGLAIAAIVLVLAHPRVAARPARWMRARDGRAFLLAAAIYAVVRIGIEALRGDSGRGIYGGLSSGQIFSVLVLVALAARVVVGHLRTRHLAPVTAALAAVALVVTLTRDADADSAAAAPATMPAPSMPSPSPTSATTHDDTPHVEVGLLYGVAVPINRRPDQVATLGGPSLSVGLARGRTGLWLDFESLGNADASHGTVLVSGSIVSPMSPKLSLGGRAGIGATLVNFDEPAFRDVMGPTVRAEAIVDYRVGDQWLLWVRPLSIDVLSAADLGGPIATWQVRLGLAHTFGGARHRPMPPMPPPVAPAPPPPPATTPTPPPNPYEPAAGAEGGICRLGGACDPGLTCASNRCVVLPPARTP